MLYTTIASLLKGRGAGEIHGTTQYIADIRLPGILWGRALRSPLPHVRIVQSMLPERNRFRMGHITCHP